MANLTVALGQISLKVDKSVLTRQWTKTLPQTEQELVQKVLQIAKVEQAASDGQRRSPRIDSATCEELLAITASRGGVIRALSMNVMQHWVTQYPERSLLCVQQGGVQLMLDILSCSLLAPRGDPSTREAASLAVMTLKQLAKDATEQTSQAFRSAQGMSVVLNLACRLTDHRALGLTLYLLNDITRRCPEVLEAEFQQTAVQLLVNILRRPINEATKFAALLLNRWALSADIVPVMQEAGAQEALLGVLLTRRVSGPFAGATEVEASAYALSAASILAQSTLDATRAHLLTDSELLAAVSCSVADYEHCFNGVGFPHALLCSLLAGPQGAQVVAAVAANGLVPTWLAARTVGSKLVERASRDDAHAAMAALPQEHQVAVAVALTHLIPLSNNLVHCLHHSDRVESLTRGAVAELLRSSSFDEAVKHDAADVQAITSEDATNSMTTVATDVAEAANVGALIMEVHNITDNDIDVKQLPRQSTDNPIDTPDTPTHSNNRAVLSRSGDLSLDFSNALKQAEAEAVLPSPGLPNLSTPQHNNQASGAVHAAEEVEPERPCSTALARLLQFLTTTDEDEATPTEPEDLSPAGALTRSSSARERSAKRQCFGPRFCRGDIGADRYDALTFVVGNRPVKAVGFVLESRSTFLRNLLSTLVDVKERVVVPTVAGLPDERMHALFLLAVEWCYTGEVPELGLEDAADLWILAEFLQMDGLQRYCEIILQDGFASNWALVQRCYDLGTSFASGRPLRVAVARHILDRMTAEEECASEVKLALTMHGNNLAQDMAEAILDRLS